MLVRKYECYGKGTRKDSSTRGINDIKFDKLDEEIDIIQQSKLSSGNKWKHIIEDTREAVHKILSKNLNCN